MISRDVVGPTPHAVMEAEALLGRLAAEAEVDAMRVSEAAGRMAVEEPSVEGRGRSSASRQTTGS